MRIQGHSFKLLNHLKIKKKLISYHKFNERKKVSEIIQYINQGKILSLISDAGTPLLSDPGRLLLNECIKRKINVIPIPGASSITSAISVSGFSDQFLFYGFLPKTENELNKTLKTLSQNFFFHNIFYTSYKSQFLSKKLSNLFFRKKNNDW